MAKFLAYKSYSNRECDFFAPDKEYRLSRILLEKNR